MAKYLLVGPEKKYQVRNYSLTAWQISKPDNGTVSTSIFVPKSVARLIKYPDGATAFFIFQNWFYQRNTAFFKIWTADQLAEITR